MGLISKGYHTVARKGGGSSGGGGGSSGEVDWPDYLKDRHKIWMSTNVVDGDRVNMDQAIEEAWDASPYTDGFTHDPTQDIADVLQRIDEFTAELDGISPEESYARFVERAITEADTILGDDVKTDIIEAFRERNLPELMRAQARFSAGMGDIGAINSSAYAIGLAALERNFFNEISRLSAELSLQEYNQRQGLVLNMAAAMTSLLQFRTEMSRAVAGMVAEIKRVNIIAQTEFLSKDLEIAAKDSSWNLEIWQYASNMLAAVSGGTSIPGSSTQGDVHQTPSMLSNSIGGFMAGAGTGAMIGSAIPGVGTAVGAVAGGILGLAGNLSM